MTGDGEYVNRRNQFEFTRQKLLLPELLGNGVVGGDG
jgi:hypothetical protein